MTVEPSELEGRTFEGETITADPWMAHLWTAATTESTALEVTGHGSGKGERAVAPPTLAVAVAREAVPLSALEERLRDGDRGERPVFLGGHRFSFARPIHVGNTYHVSATVASVERKSGRRGPFAVVTIVSEATDGSGSIAFELETDVVVRSVDSAETVGANGTNAAGDTDAEDELTVRNDLDEDGGSNEDGGSAEEDADDGTEADDPHETTQPTTADRLAVGTTVGRRPIEVDPSQLQLLSAILRDPNPIHYDPAAAAEAGHAGRVAQGPISAEFLAQAALEVVESAADLRTLDVRYESFVLEEETLTATAAVAAVDREAATATLDLELRKADGTVTATGTAVVTISGDRLES